MKPACSAFLFRPEKFTIIFAVIAAPCSASTTGAGLVASCFLGTKTMYERFNSPTVRVRVCSPADNALTGGGADRQRARKVNMVRLPLDEILQPYPGLAGGVSPRNSTSRPCVALSRAARSQPSAR